MKLQQVGCGDEGTTSIATDAVRKLTASYELVWQHRTSGQRSFWYWNGTSFISGGIFATVN